MRHESINLPPLDGRSWSAGHFTCGARVMISESEANPGFYHFEVVDLRRWVSERSNRPVRSDYVGAAIEMTLVEMGLSLPPDAEWSEDGAAIQDVRPMVLKTFPEVVYFVTAGPFVKIGTTNGDPAARIASLQTGCPYEMRMVAFVHGGRAEESVYHERFGAYHERGEWFRLEGRLAGFLAQVEAA